jgi:hypothetical protein
MLMTAPIAPVRPRLLIRLRDCATQRSEKISKGPCFRYISRTDQRGDREPDYDGAERYLHQGCFVSAAYRARLR